MHTTDDFLPNVVLDNSVDGCHFAIKVSVDGTEVTTLRRPSKGLATVLGIPHTVAVGQRRSLTIKVRMSNKRCVSIGVLPAGHPHLAVIVSFLSAVAGTKGASITVARDHVPPISSMMMIQSRLRWTAATELVVTEWCAFITMGRLCV